MGKNNASNFTEIFIVIPAYKVGKSILKVVQALEKNYQNIIVVDDNCPEYSGKIIEGNKSKGNVRVIYHHKNLGVGAATKSGYLAAINAGARIIVKIDGDGQMDVNQIENLVNPIRNGAANYAKGDRFRNLENLHEMPKVRLIGNLLLSFMAKFSTGYWNIFDPNNGFTAIDANLLAKIPLTKIDNRYFFETDMLFRMGLLNAVIADVSMPSRYRDEESNLHISKIVFEFAYKHLRILAKRIAYRYYIYDFSLASITLPAGSSLFIFGMVYGGFNYINSMYEAKPSPVSALLIVVLSLISGLQLLLHFFTQDVANEQRVLKIE